MKKKPTKYFLLQEKQKQKKTNNNFRKQTREIFNNKFILKECTNYFQKIYTKQKTCETTQNILLKQISHKTTNEQNHKLTKKIRNKRNKRSNSKYGKREIPRGGWYTHRIV